MTIPALVLIDRVKILTETYRARAVQANARWNELRRNGKPRTEKIIAARDAAEFDNIADELDRLVQP